MSDPQFDGSGQEDGEDIHDGHTASTGTTPRIREEPQTAASNDGIAGMLDLLTAAAEQFRAATTAEQFGRIVDETVRQALDVDVVCVRKYDERANELHTVVRSEAASRLVTETPTLDLDRSRAGRAYRTGEVVEDRGVESTLSSQSLDGTGVHGPVDGWGVVSLAVPSQSYVPASTRETVGSLCRSFAVEARRLAERIEFDRTHHATETERQQSERTQRIQRSVQAATEAVLRSQTASDAAETVVERVATVPSVHAARLVEHGSTGIETVATGVTSDPNVEHVTERHDSLADSRFISRLDDTTEVVRVSDPDPVVHSTGVKPADDSRQVTLVAPLGDGSPRDALVVTIERAAATVAVETSFASLAHVVGETLSAKRVADLVAADRIVELTFEVTSEDCLAVAVSARLNCDCAVRRMVPRGDGRVVSYLRVEDSDPERAVAVTNELSGTVSATLVGQTPTDCRIEVVRESSAASGLLSAGGSARAATATNGVGKLVVEALQTANLDTLVDGYTAETGATLVSKKTVKPTGGPSIDPDDTTGLTDRQREVVRAAVGAGYYEWPRERTAEEVAESLGISVSTFSEHLRTAHRRIVETYLQTSCDI